MSEKTLALIENPRLYRCRLDLYLARRGFPINASDFSSTRSGCNSPKNSWVLRIIGSSIHTRNVTTRFTGHQTFCSARQLNVNKMSHFL
jgi:hypothetical protein